MNIDKLNKDDLSNRIEKLKLNLADSMFDLKIAQKQEDSEMINSVTTYRKELTNQIDVLEQVRKNFN